MTFEEFHNGLRVLLNIDGDEFVKAVYGLDKFPPVGSDEWWQHFDFSNGAHDWFIRAPDAHARAIWAIVEERGKRK